MLEVEVEIIGDEILDSVIEACEDFPGLIPEVMDETIEQIGPDILGAFQQEPGPSGLQKNWTSDKQRRFVWGKITRGEWTSPFPRQHAISQGWKIYAVSYSAGEASGILENEVEGVEYVEGVEQQQWHKQTGWLYAPDLAAEWSDKLSTLALKNLRKAFRKKTNGRRR